MMNPPEGVQAMTIDQVRFDAQGLVPAIVQDADSGRVLTMAYMNRDALERTLSDGQTWLWSRSRAQLWHKGATSGHTQNVRGVLVDCDADAVLVLVEPAGPACHTGARTCFFTQLSGTLEEPFAALADLARTVAARAADGDPASSYTASLLARGIDTVCKKVGEEATEVVLAAKGAERDQVIYESADLLYHLTVLWEATGVRPHEVATELARRRAPVETNGTP
jgi:phosphoribosyl-AMP cyclohydrolase / phosphoribosyl-ATP pyrophosphohydrolase